MSPGIAWTDATWNPVVGCSLARHVGGTAYALAEAAEDLTKVTSGEATLDDFRGAYVVSKDPIDPDGVIPARR